MARPANAINHEVVREADKVLGLLESYFDAYRSEAELLAEKYLEARADGMATHNQSFCHGLFLSFETKTCEETGLRFGYLYWRLGRTWHNSASARASRRGGTPITRVVHSCGADGCYSRKNLRAAMPFARPWEVRLTYQFEQEAHKIRRFLRALNNVKRSLLYFPIPPIPMRHCPANGMAVSGLMVRRKKVRTMMEIGTMIICRTTGNVAVT